jgi:hypothetical protein
MTASAMPLGGMTVAAGRLGSRSLSLGVSILAVDDDVNDMNSFRMELSAQGLAKHPQTRFPDR